MDKVLILNELKKYLKFRYNKDFALYLGINTTTLAMWYNRNTFDTELIFNKCEFINPEWLLTGRGEMLKVNALKKQNDFSEPKTERELLIQELADARLQIIELQRAQIEKNEETKKTTTNN